MSEIITCFRCGKEKPRSEFYDLIHCTYCKQCRHEIYILNKDHVREQQKNYRDNHVEELKAYRKLRKAEIAEKNKRYYQSNKWRWGVKV